MILGKIPGYRCLFIIGLLVTFIFFVFFISPEILTHPKYPEQNKNSNCIITFSDAKGRTVTLSHPAKRVVCLGSNIPDMMGILGAESTLVGVPDGVLGEDNRTKNRLLNAKSIGGSSNPDLETIISLNPDLVIPMSQTNPVLEERMEQAGIPVAYINGYIVTDIPEEMKMLAKITGNESGADKFTLFYTNIASLVETRVANISPEDRPKVYFESTVDYSTFGKGSGCDALLKLAGGINIAGNISQEWPKISPEYVVEYNPDIIYKIAFHGVDTNETMSGYYDNVISRSVFANVSAVKNRRVYVINTNSMYGPLGIVALVYIVKSLHPEEFVDVDPDQIFYEYSMQFDPGTSREITMFYPPLNRSKTKNMGVAEGAT